MILRFPVMDGSFETVSSTRSVSPEISVGELNSSRSVVIPGSFDIDESVVPGETEAIESIETFSVSYTSESDRLLVAYVGLWTQRIILDRSSETRPYISAVCSTPCISTTLDFRYFPIFPSSTYMLIPSAIARLVTIIAEFWKKVCFLYFAMMSFIVLSFLI